MEPGTLAPGEVDGLWIVETPSFVAGFVIEWGRVTACAPILRRRIAYWRTQAKWVCE